MSGSSGAGSPSPAQRPRRAGWGIVATLLLATTAPASSFAELEAGQERLLAALRSLGAPLAPVLQDPRSALLEALRLLARFGLVRTELSGEETLYQADRTQRLTLVYYRNTIVHHLRGLLELSQALLHLGGGEHLRPHVYQVFETIDRALAAEFVVAHDDSPRRRFDPAMRYLEGLGVLVDRPGGRVQFLRERREVLTFFLETASDFLEGYWFSLRVLWPGAAAQAKSGDPERAVVSAGERALERGYLRRPECLSRPLLDTAWSTLREFTPADRHALTQILRPIRLR